MQDSILRNVILTKFHKWITENSGATSSHSSHHLWRTSLAIKTKKNRRQQKNIVKEQPAQESGFTITNFFTALITKVALWVLFSGNKSYFSEWNMRKLPFYTYQCNDTRVGRAATQQIDERAIEIQDGRARVYIVFVFVRLWQRVAELLKKRSYNENHFFCNSSFCPPQNY